MKKKPVAMTDAFYVYLIGKNTDIEAALRATSLPPSLEPGAMLSLVSADALAAVVSRVPLDHYGEGEFESRLKDPTWAADKVMRHQAVTTFFSSNHPVVPLKFGVLYSTTEKIEAMLREHAPSLKKSLERIKGCEEWALNLYVDKAALADKIATLSPKLTELLSRAEKSSQGQAYLLQKQAEKMRATEAKDYLKRTADEIASSLSPRAREMKRIPSGEHEAKQTPAVAGKFAYLVAREKLEAFQAEAEKMAARHAGSGFRLELTGPWPPYNFVE